MKFAWGGAHGACLKSPSVWREWIEMPAYAAL